MKTTRNQRAVETKKFRRKFGHSERLYEVTTKLGREECVWRVAAPAKKEALRLLRGLRWLEDTRVLSVKRVSGVVISPKTLERLGLV